MKPPSTRIAILDSVPKIYWKEDNGITDGEKFIDLLSPVNPNAIFDIFYVSENHFPDSIGDYDAYLLTGSPVSVHDDYEWINTLSAWIVNIYKSEKPMFGVCFGHQLIAKCFGGRIDKCANGWMIGNYEMQLNSPPSWLNTSLSRSSIFHFNKERITQLPDLAQSFANSNGYANFAYTLGNNIACIQGHPEQSKRAIYNFLNAVIHSLSKSDIERANLFIENGRPDSVIWAQSIMQFLCR